MKSIIDNNIEALVFDLDGTLYDEYKFVKQAYVPISEYLSEVYQIPQKDLYNSLCDIWKEKGSSANVFQAALDLYGDKTLNQEVIRHSVELYRTCDFKLTMDQNVIDFLNNYKHYPMAIVTDGFSELQKRKYTKLNLDKWIDKDCVFVSGDYGKQYYKPNPYMADLVKEKLNTDKIVYFGDREVDRQFAHNAGFEFVQVKNMIEV